MKKLIIIPLLFFAVLGYTQEYFQDTSLVYKKRVLESTEVDFLTSYYTQDGYNASVTGGIGTEELKDIATNIILSIPLNDDDVLTIDLGISAYTSASSANLNPFNKPGENDEDDRNYESGTTDQPTGSPWVAPSGASQGDLWLGLTAGYSHSSDDRNKIWSTHISYATEYDYKSFGFGGGYTRLFNEKNTELSIKGNIFLDKWDPAYPIEIISYLESGEDLSNGYFEGLNILDQSGNIIDKDGTNVWSPINTTLIENKNRNTYALSLSFSQILNKKAQFSIFFDLVAQKGWLANPMQRVYFSDRDNYYIGNASSIPIYTSKDNIDVFQLADDIERLPDARYKFPIGARFNYYINEIVVIRTYYRYYFDNWGVNSHTFDVEVPVKITRKFTLYPSYRYYTQTAADYFAPYEEHLSTSKFYTSDYDLSEFNTNQYSLGLRYTDIFTNFHVGKLGLKSIDLRYSYYQRNTGLNAGLISLGLKFVID